MFELERTATVDGYYFASRLAGMSVINDPTMKVAPAATDCQGTIILNMDDLEKGFPELQAQAMVVAHEIRHNDGLHMDRLESLIENHDEWKNNPKIKNNLAQLMNIVTDLVINEGLYHSFPVAAEKFHERMNVYGGISWDTMTIKSPQIIAACEKAGYTKSNIYKMDAFKIVEEIFEEIVEVAEQAQQGQGDQQESSKGGNSQQEGDSGGRGGDVGENEEAPEQDNRDAGGDEDDDIVDQILDDLVNSGGQGDQKGDSKPGKGQPTDIDALVDDDVPMDILDEESIKKSKENGEVLNGGLSVDAGEAQRAAVQQANKRAQEAGMKGMGAAGCIPGHLVGEFEELKEPKVNFKGLLRNCMTKQAKDRPGFRNRRSMAKHKIWHPHRSGRELGTIAILIDTSGSVSNEVLKDMMSEADNALRNLNYNKCVVIQFSNQIESIKEYDRRHRISGIDRKVYGRGGTEIKLAINELNKYKDLDATVIMTDGGLYDIQRVAPDDERQFKRAAAYWFVPQDDVGGINYLKSEYLEKGGHGELMLYHDHGLKMEKQARKTEKTGSNNIKNRLEKQKKQARKTEKTSGRRR